MVRRPLGIFARYTAAAISVAAGVGFRLALVQVLGPAVPYVTFFPAVMFSAWFGGFGPGMFAAVLTLWLAVGLSLSSGSLTFKPSVAGAAGGLIFLAVSFFISALTEALRRSRDRSEQRLAVLQAETKRRAAAEEDLARTSRKAELDRDLLRTTLASIADCIVALDPGGKVTFLNSAAERLTGCSQQESEGRPVQEILTILNERTRLPMEIQALRAIRERITVGSADDAVLITRDGREVLIEEKAAPISDEREGLLGAVLVFRDVTQRRESQRALKQSEERLKLALEAGQIGVWDWNMTDERIELSDRLCQIHGLTPGSFPGRVDDFINLVHPADRASITLWMRTISEGTGPFAMQFRINRSTGESRWLSSTALVVRNEAGEAVRILGATLDITNIKSAQEELQMIKQDLTRANRDLEEFAYVASHDLQEPLRMVSIYTQLIGERLRNSDGDVTQYGIYVREGVQRMTALISDLLEYSRSSYIEATPVGKANLSESLSQAEALLINDISESGAIVNAQSLPETRGETSQMSHVFQNLLSNAIKYRKRGTCPTIDIRAEREGDQWVISVQDDGIGFEPQYAERIFGLFKRLHKGEYPGTGLGLAICQRILERYGGGIWAESALGKGATFRFRLPSAERSESDSTHEAAQSLPIKVRAGHRGA